MKKRRLLFVWSSAEFSTFDVATGYRKALERTGLYDIKDYRTSARMRYHAKALGEEISANMDLLTRCASENVVIEAMRYSVDVVFIVSGLALHPDAVWYLRRVGIKTVVLFTESPYDDEPQREFHAVYPEMQCFTMERTSAHTGWKYVPHSYDPDVHKPAVCTVPIYEALFIGTLWSTRIKLLETVNWDKLGISPTFKGTWVAPPIPADSPLGEYYVEGCIKNEQAALEYTQALVGLNPFRENPVAESLNPRSFELAACGVFQLSDYRPELDDVFGAGVAPTFKDAETLEQQLAYWLSHDRERRERIEEMRRAVQPCTFDNRLRDMLEYL